jgi:hypothetical protein
MVEQHYKVNVAASIAGVSSDTLVRWLEKLDLSFVRGARGRGKAALIPESILKRVLERHSVRVADYRETAA